MKAIDIQLLQDNDHNNVIGNKPENAVNFKACIFLSFTIEEALEFEITEMIETNMYGNYG